MGRVQDKVVLVTGAARGQGRSHSVKLAEDGADIILFDICHDIATNEYPLGTARDLEEAGLEVEKTGRTTARLRDRFLVSAAPVEEDLRRASRVTDHQVMAGVDLDDVLYPA